MSVTHPGQPLLTAGELGLCTPPADPVAAAATEAYVAAWRSPNGAAVGAAVSAGVAEALRRAGVVVVPDQEG